MPDLLAKGTAVAVAALLVISVGILVLTSRPSAGAQEVRAEFENAFPLIEGMHVRVDGAIAGSVNQIEVNERGNALVTLSLSDAIEEPMADASAAIRQQDTTGDSYVAFDPGGHPGAEGSEEPLGDQGLVCTDHDTCPRTLVSPRLDDLLNAFGPAERSGVQLILVETAKMLDQRGIDVNDAALDLREGLHAANLALSEVNEQNEALKRLITSAESVTGQAARRDQELGRLIESLAQITNATASESASRDAGRERLPATAQRARTTLAALSRAAVAARPLAEQLAAGAPQLADALELLPPFLEDASAWIEGSTPTLKLTRRLLHTALPTLKIGKKRIITGPFDLTGATADLLNAVLGGEDAFPALFGDDSYGDPDAGTLDAAGFGAVAVEPGNQPGYPAEHEDRNWLRVSGVINCEVFGRKIEPGCLAGVLDSLPVSAKAADGRGKQGSNGPFENPDGLKPELDGLRGGGLADALDDALGGLPGADPGRGTGTDTSPPLGPDALNDLLDFLQG